MPHSLDSHLHPSGQAIEAYKARGELHPDLVCPITHEELVQPVRVGVNGTRLYSEDALLTWARRSPVDPFTRESLRGQLLIREPQATAAINALRRGAADLHMEEGNAQAATALYRQAAGCEAVDAQRPVGKLPGPRRLPSASAAIMGCRIAAGLCCVGSLALGVKMRLDGYVPSRTSQTTSAGTTASSLTFALSGPGLRQPVAMVAAYAATAAAYMVLPGSAELIGVAVGVGVALYC